jgi:hypothetical protein
MWHKFFIAIVTLLCWQLSNATDWQKLSQLDLTASYNLLKNNSAGGADQENPAYQIWLKQGYQQALSMAKKVNNASSYNLVMNFYTNGFHDEHVQYVPYLKRFDFMQTWPGFTIYWQHQHFYVRNFSHTAPKQSPPTGAELLSCDKQSVKHLLLTRVFPYFGNPALNASWHIVTPRLFFYSQNPWYSRLKQCTFLIGKYRKTYTLHWRDINETHAYNIRMQTNYSYQGKFSATTFAKNSIWVSIPSFLPEAPSAITAFKKIIKQAPNWRNKKLLVIDMRGNLGGNSLWGTELLTSLYGNAYYQQQTAKLMQPSYQWRVSSDNLGELKGFYSRYIAKNFGKKSQAYQELQQTINGMQQALHNHQAYYPANVEQPSATTTDTVISNPVKATIVFLTDGRCASSCLTFADQLFTFPNVIQAGQPTHASTNYTESVVTKLPGGARLYYPMKVQRFRQRKSNQAYIPEKIYYYIGNVNDTAQVASWLMKILD